jgi:hypothetical protein
VVGFVESREGKTLNRSERWISTGLLLVSVGLLVSCQRTVGGGLESIPYLKEDYGRSDLVLIEEVGTSDKDITNTWKISEESLAKETPRSLAELLAATDVKSLILEATRFVDLAYDGLWKNKLDFLAFSYVNVDPQKWGPDLATKRNDWIFVCDFREKGVEDSRISERVFLLPSGRVVISKTNYEDVR